MLFCQPGFLSIGSGIKQIMNYCIPSCIICINAAVSASKSSACFAINCFPCPFQSYVPVDTLLKNHRTQQGTTLKTPRNNVSIFFVRYVCGACTSIKYYFRWYSFFKIFSMTHFSQFLLYADIFPFKTGSLRLPSTLEIHLKVYHWSKMDWFAGNHLKVE